MEDREEAVANVLSLLESLRLPETEQEIEQWFSRSVVDPGDGGGEELPAAYAENAGEAESLIDTLVGRADDRDLHNLGVVVLGPVLQTFTAGVAGFFEKRIREDARFRSAFSHASMTGVPIEIQRQLNAAMLESGADASEIAEYDTGEDEV